MSHQASVFRLGTGATWTAQLYHIHAAQAFHTFDVRTLTQKSTMVETMVPFDKTWSETMNYHGHSWEMNLSDPNLTSTTVKTMVPFDKTWLKTIKYHSHPRTSMNVHELPR